MAPRFPDSHDGIRKLIDDHIPYRNLQDAKVPVHIVTTDIISGDSVVLSEGSTARGDRRLDRDPRRFRAGPLQGLLSRRRRDLQQHADPGRGPERREAADHPADRACLRHAGAAGRRGRQCAACADAADRAAIGQRAGGPRPGHRIFRGAAAMPAGGIALRFLAHGRSHRARHRDAPMRGWPKAACSRAAFPTRCGRTATETRGNRPRYAALQKACCAFNCARCN